MSNELMQHNTSAVDLWQNKSSLAEIRDYLKKACNANLSDAEFDTFVAIGKATQLNPFLKEIWCVKYGNAPASIFIARDGYRKSAQQNKDYDYHHVDAVYSNDEYHYHPVTGDIHHKYNFKDRGELIGAYGLVKRRSSTRPHYVYVELREYDKKQSNWKSMPATMIKKVAEAQCLRMAFQELFSGTYDESEHQAYKANVISTNDRTESLNAKFGISSKEPELIEHDQETGEIIPASKTEIKKLREMISDNDFAQELVDKWLEHAKAKSFEDMTSEQVQKCIKFIQNRNEYEASKG